MDKDRSSNRVEDERSQHGHLTEMPASTGKAPMRSPIVIGTSKGHPPRKIPINVPPPAVTAPLSQPRIVPVTVPTTQQVNVALFPPKPIIAVFGGTGNQGKSVVRALLNDGRYDVRIMSRNPSTKKCCAKFESMGATIVQGSMHHPEDVRRFLHGVYGVFFVTDFWDPESMGREDVVTKEVSRIAKESGVKHFVWSTTPNISWISKGRYHAPHFANKTKIDRFVKKLGFPSWTFVMPAFYYQNFTSYFAPTNENGILTWKIPLSEDKFLPAADIHDLGPTVLQIFNYPKMYHAKKIPIAGDNLHPQDYIVKLGLVAKLPVKVVLISPEEFAKLPIHGAKEIGEMFSYVRDYSYYGNKYDWHFGREVNPNMKTWEQYLRLEFQKSDEPTSPQ